MTVNNIMGLVLVCLVLLTTSFCQGRALSTGISKPSSGPEVVMVFDNRTIGDGETVVVGAARDENRKEVVVECAARGAPDHAVLACPFYAQNANLLDEQNSAECGQMTASLLRMSPSSGQERPSSSDSGHLVSCKRIALEAGGFLKLQCVLTHPNVTGPLASVMANFTLQQSTETTTTTESQLLTTSTPVSRDMNLYPNRQASPMSKNAQLDSKATCQHVISTLIMTTLCILLLILN